MTTENRSLEARVGDIPNNGFWKVSSRSSFIVAAHKLRALGMSDDEAVIFLADLYRAAAHEFGA